MTTIVTCAAPYGAGGVGQHFAQVVEDARAAGTLGRVLAPSVPAGDPRFEAVPVPLAGWVHRPPLRFWPEARAFFGADLFDRAAARRLPERPERVVGFVGQALQTFRRARALGAERLELVALNTHPRHVLRQHAAARADWPIERTWMSERLARKTEAEIAAADVVWVHSGLARETFRAAGIPDATLRRMVLRVDPRFQPPERPPVRDGTFRIVTVGRVSIDKGTPVLVEAFRRLPDPDARLTIVGGWSTRGMRRFMDAARAADSRIEVAPGDPLPLLQRADLYVQASYEDGFCYAAAEALAAGVPVVVTDQTGMQERVAEGETGWVVPAGDVGALADRIASVHARQGLRAGVA